ncbi:MAG: ATP-binding cassette domain-containing protein [Bacteroidota bacterium]
MKIILQNISKHYSHHELFRDFNYIFESENSYAITGSNGSGKTTLLKIISGLVTPTSGTISYQLSGKTIPVEKIFRTVAIAAPYMELIEEFTLSEILKFHVQLKPFYSAISIADAIKMMSMNEFEHQPIKSYSSGMKQKIKLGMALYSNTPLLLLDEPISNLDNNNIEWYQNSLRTYRKNRLTIICSNLKIEEYPDCGNIIDITQNK